MQESPRTLIADDQPDVLEALRLLLKHEGYEIDSASSPRGVLEKLRSRSFDVLLMDLNYAMDTTSGKEGLDLLTGIRQIDSTLPVVVMTAWGSIPLAVEAMRRGARDFVQKPWDNMELLSTLRAQVQHGRRDGARGELEDAREIQRRLLPAEVPAVAGYDIAVAWQPASSVTGDYVDVLPQSGGAALSIADAAGHGMAAALLMSNVQAATRALAAEGLSPAALTARVNRVVARNAGSNKFITYFFGLLAHGELRYVNAGHCPPILLRDSGEIERLETGGPVLGVFADACYEEGVVAISPGDRLVLFTDGIPEAETAGEVEFGEERLLNLLRANRSRPADELRTILIGELGAFCAGRLRDDASFVIVDARSPDGGAAS